MVDFVLTCFNTCILRNFGCSILHYTTQLTTAGCLSNPKIGWIRQQWSEGIPSIHQAGEQGARFGEETTCFNTMISGFPRFGQSHLFCLNDIPLHLHAHSIWDEHLTSFNNTTGLVQRCKVRCAKTLNDVSKKRWLARGMIQTCPFIQVVSHLLPRRILRCSLKSVILSHCSWDMRGIGVALD
jgi:hypothetical protein